MKLVEAQAAAVPYRQYPILYVDDERVALELFRMNFSEEFQVFTALSAEAAFEILQKEPIALVLSDQRMTGMTGTEFFAAIQKTHPEIVRILVTGYVDFQSVVEAINAGHVYHYVEKPWEEDELRLTLRRGLEHYHLVRERDRLQAERIKTLENMARSNRLAAVGTLAAGIAHEIRNPLSAVLTFHQMLPEKIDACRLNPDELNDEFWSKFSKLPLREVERIKRLIQELLDFARDSGTTYALHTGDLAALLEPLLPMIESDIRRKGVVLHRDIEADLHPVDIDGDKIKQVAINLLLNAMHATPEGGSITLRIRNTQDPPGCELIVEDTGCGIRPEDVERVFDPFFTTRDPGVGTGLGLTMCHYIVQHHNGRIALQSEVDRGTTVRVWLPASVPSHDAQAAAPAEVMSLSAPAS